MALGPGPAAAPAPSRGWPPARWTAGWPWLLAAGATVCYSAVSVLRYLHGNFSSWDLAIFTQGVAGYAHGGLPISTVRGGPGFDLLGDHFSPALAVLAPGYLVFPSPVYLLVVQAALFGVSTVPIARLATRRLGDGSAALIAVAYALSWGLQQAVVVDFHEVALAVPLASAGLCALAERRWRAAAAWLLPLTLVKEDLGLTIAVAGAYVAWQGARRLGLGLVLAGGTATALEVWWLIPAVNRAHRDPNFPHFGTDHSALHLVSSLILPEPKPATLLLLTGVTAFGCLRSPLALLAVPTLLWRFESDNTTYWGQQYHYSAALMPIVFVALLDAMQRLRGGRSRRGALVALHLPAVVATVAVMAVRLTPLGSYLSLAAYRPTAQEQLISAVTRLVPAGASVETDIGLMSHLTAGRTTYFIGNNTATVTPQFIVTDQAAWSSAMQGTQVLDYARTLHPGARYQMAFQRGGVTVLRLAALAR